MIGLPYKIARLIKVKSPLLMYSRGIRFWLFAIRFVSPRPSIIALMAIGVAVVIRIHCPLLLNWPGSRAASAIRVNVMLYSGQVSLWCASTMSRLFRFSGVLGSGVSSSPK